MDSSAKTPLKSSQFTNSDFNALSSIFLEYYEDGKYSDDGLADGECNAGNRKTLKHTFKEHILGDAKYIATHNGETKNWSKYTACLLKCLLDSDTAKVIEKNRKIKKLNKQLKEEIDNKERNIQVRVNDATKFIMEDARNTVDEELRERCDRIEGRFKKYQDQLNSYMNENKILNEQLDTYVSRSDFDAHTATILEQKLELEKLRGDTPKKKELTDEEKKAKKIKKKKKELKALLESVDISTSSDDESSSSDSD